MPYAWQEKMIKVGDLLQFTVGLWNVLIKCIPGRMFDEGRMI